MNPAIFIIIDIIIGYIYVAAWLLIIYDDDRRI